jgi:zinc protease
LLIGQTGVNRSHPDFYPLYLGNHIFGGSGLTAILSGEIREKKGLAYSVYSHFSKMQSNGSFIIKLQTKNSQANEAKKIAITFLPYTYYDKFISVNQTRKGVLNILRANILDFVSKGV